MTLWKVCRWTLKTKFKMAIAQAAKLDGLTADKILATFDGLKNRSGSRCE